MNISAGAGVAVRAFPLETGEADYLLYADGKAVGVVEAKLEGHTLKGVEKQSMGYLNGLPAEIPNHGRSLPFHYESTGKVTQFTNLLDPDPRSREVFTFHRPDELIPEPPTRPDDPLCSAVIVECSSRGVQRRCQGHVAHGNPRPDNFE